MAVLKDFCKVIIIALMWKFKQSFWFEDMPFKWSFHLLEHHRFPPAELKHTITVSVFCPPQISVGKADSLTSILNSLWQAGMPMYSLHQYSFHKIRFLLRILQFQAVKSTVALCQGASSKTVCSLRNNCTKFGVNEAVSVLKLKWRLTHFHRKFISELLF